MDNGICAGQHLPLFQFYCNARCIGEWQHGCSWRKLKLAVEGWPTRTMFSRIQEQHGSEYWLRYWRCIDLDSMVCGFEGQGDEPNYRCYQLWGDRGKSYWDNLEEQSKGHSTDWYHGERTCGRWRSWRMGLPDSWIDKLYLMSSQPRGETLSQ